MDAFDLLKPVDRHTRIQLNSYLGEIEEIFEADAITIFSPIRPQVANAVKRAIDLLSTKKERIVVILQTSGGVVEVTERIVDIIRHTYNEVDFLIPDYAMSAGTVLAMVGNRIFMSHSSCLGPIDPQIVRDDKLIPALGYLNEYEILKEKSRSGNLTTVEFALVDKLDLAELHECQQARELSIDLLTNWLSNYKFKDWDTHSSSGKKVTEKEKQERAKKIADALSDNKRWHSHARMLPRTVLSELGLKIEEMEGTKGLLSPLNNYVDLLSDYMSRGDFQSFIHSREYF